jgi:GTPase
MSRPRALLVGIHTPDRSLEAVHASLDELSRLADTLGMDEIGRLVQRRQGTGAMHLLGEGKLRELAAWTGGTGVVQRGPPPKRTGTRAEDPDAVPPAPDADALLEALPEFDPAPFLAEMGVPPGEPVAQVVIVNHELSPSQLRNLRSAAGCEVLDRNGVIIEIFHQRAKSREARAQVELARLAYLSPRLRELGGASERQRGGIGGKGAGESSLELDRRKVRDRMAELRRELADIEANRGVRRERRQDLRQVALVGYTNAGKSSLMRALTGAEPYVADQLFATLDTTVRRLSPELTPPVLVTDTVGFISDLPHSLVASFRSTLDAALEAGLLLHVVDASDPAWREEEAVTAQVLADIGAETLPRVLLFNKCDRLGEGEEAALLAERPFAWATSAHDPARVAELHARIAAHFGRHDEEVELFVPWSHAAAMGQVHARARVLAEDFEAEGVRYRLCAPAEVLAALRRAAGAPDEAAADPGA